MRRRGADSDASDGDSEARAAPPSLRVVIRVPASSSESPRRHPSLCVVIRVSMLSSESLCRHPSLRVVIRVAVSSSESPCPRARPPALPRASAAAAAARATTLVWWWWPSPWKRPPPMASTAATTNNNTSFTAAPLMPLFTASPICFSPPSLVLNQGRVRMLHIYAGSRRGNACRVSYPTQRSHTKAPW